MAMRSLQGFHGCEYVSSPVVNAEEDAESAVSANNGESAGADAYSTPAPSGVRRGESSNTLWQRMGRWFAPAKEPLTEVRPEAHAEASIDSADMTMAMPPDLEESPPPEDISSPEEPSPPSTVDSEETVFEFPLSTYLIGHAKAGTPTISYELPEGLTVEEVTGYGKNHWKYTCENGKITIHPLKSGVKAEDLTDYRNLKFTIILSDGSDVTLKTIYTP